MTESPLQNETDQSKWWASPPHRDLDAIDDLDYDMAESLKTRGIATLLMETLAVVSWAPCRPVSSSMREGNETTYHPAQHDAAGFGVRLGW